MNEKEKNVGPRYFNGESGTYQNCKCGKRCSPSYLESNGGSCEDCKMHMRIEQLEQRCAQMQNEIEVLKKLSGRPYITTDVPPSNTFVIPRREGDDIARIT
jgi:hypothetical protein